MNTRLFLMGRPGWSGLLLVVVLVCFFKLENSQSPVETTQTEDQLISVSSIQLPDPPSVEPEILAVINEGVSASIDVVDKEHYVGVEETYSDKVVIQEGISDESVSRILFAIEQGKGPSIEIGWPQKYNVRETLFLILHDCYGMRVGRLDGGRLRAVEPMDRQQRMSAYLRVGSGAVISVEQQLLKKINGKGRPVRVFSRNFDSSLLAGFSQVYGSNLLGAKTVYGRYVVEGKALIVSDVLINGVQHESFQVDKRLNSCR